MQAVSPVTNRHAPTPADMARTSLARCEQAVSRAISTRNRLGLVAAFDQLLRIAAYGATEQHRQDAIEAAERARAAWEAA